MVREASEMSPPSTQKYSLKPAPVPSSPTKKLKFGLASWNASATACEMGATVDEPWTSTLPDMPSEVVAVGDPVAVPVGAAVGLPGPPHAARMAVVAIAR